MTDQEVLDSFVESVNPAGSDPWMLDYIKLGQFSALINDTLFVHGGVSMETIGAVPGVEQVQTVRFFFLFFWVYYRVSGLFYIV